MSRAIRLVSILGLVLMAVPSFAEDPVSSPAAAPSSTEDPGTGPVVFPPENTDPAPAAPVGIEAPAPAIPAPVAPPALKPITITFSGEVASVSAAEDPPMIAVQDRYGVKKEISVPSDAKISSGEASKSLAELKAGDKVTVEYTYDVATGKRTALTITLGEAPAPAGS